MCRKERKGNKKCVGRKGKEIKNVSEGRKVRARKEEK